MTPAAVSTGKHTSTSTLTTTMFHTKIGMRNIVMPGARMVNDGGDEVDGGEDAGDADEGDADDPQVAAEAGRADAVGQRGVGEPAEAGGAVGREEARER